MKVAIRPADLESDRQLIIDALARFLTPLSDDRRFSWLYENNPAGKGRVWFAHSEKETIGVASAFPRRVYIDGHEELSWVLGDFCMNGKYRSLGPALELQRACLAAAKTDGVRFCYDFPSQAMTAVYKRLDIPVSHKVVRLAKPLRLDRKLREIVNWPFAARGLSAIGNLYLSCNNRISKGDSALTITSHQGSCGKEFSILAGEIRGRPGISVVHSAEYLNWRYLENPLHRYELFTARRKGMLLGYAVLLHEGEDAILVDLFGVEAEVVLSALIVHVVALLMTRSVQTVSATLTKAHPWRGLLERHAFKVRETSPMVIYHPSGRGPAGKLGTDEKFLFMHGDRDS
jgi:hypothetical protein